MSENMAEKIHVRLSRRFKVRKLIEFGKYLARTMLQWTPAGRAYYAKRKAAQKAELSRNLLEHGPEILRMVHEAFTRAGYKYYVCDGTLLGVIREGSILKHDIDVDFTVMAGSATPKQVLDLALDLGFQFFWSWTYEGKVANLAFEYKGVHVDFDFLLPEEGHMSQLIFTKLDGVKYKKGDWEWSVVARPMPIVREVECMKVTQYGFDVLVPENYDEYLTAAYGTWRTPDSQWREKNLTTTPVDWVHKPSPGIRISIDDINKMP